MLQQTLQTLNSSRKKIHDMSTFFTNTTVQPQLLEKAVKRLQRIENVLTDIQTLKTSLCIFISLICEIIHYQISNNFFHSRYLNRFAAAGHREALLAVLKFKQSRGM